MKNTRYCDPNFNGKACLKCGEINAINCPKTKTEKISDIIHGIFAFSIAIMVMWFVVKILGS